MNTIYHTDTGKLEGGCARNYHGKFASDAVLQPKNQTLSHSMLWSLLKPPPGPEAYQPWMNISSATAVGSVTIGTEVAFHGACESFAELYV